MFLLADHGYAPYSTTIETMKPWFDANKDVAKRFVEASIIGWYNYLYGDNAGQRADQEGQSGNDRRADRLLASPR